MIKASRNFINVRLNTWADARNHQRVRTVLGTFGDVDEQQNTVFALFEPDAEGLTADSFPTEESMLFGTRPGHRRIFIPSMANAPTEKVRELITQFRRNDTGGLESDPELIDRIVWESQNVTDGVGLAKLMNSVSAKYPGKPGSADQPRLLPVMYNLGQAIDIASCDTRALVVVVHPDEGPDEDMEARLTVLAFEEGIAGRTHFARMTASEWARSKELATIKGGKRETGLFFVAPDPYGMSGEVWAEIDQQASLDGMREGLASALDRFRKEWRKEDRLTHITKGVEAGMSWTEYDPDQDKIVYIDTNSKKLLDRTGH